MQVALVEVVLVFLRVLVELDGFSVGDEARATLEDVDFGGLRVSSRFFGVLALEAEVVQPEKPLFELVRLLLLLVLHVEEV